MPPLAVVFDRPVPPLASGDSAGIEAQQRWYYAQAEALVKAMEKTAPGGFMDALLGALLIRKATVFAVPDVILGREATGADHP